MLSLSQISNPIQTRTTAKRQEKPVGDSTDGIGPFPFVLLTLYSVIEIRINAALSERHPKSRNDVVKEAAKTLGLPSLP